MATITCGNCHGKHETVRAVKLCHETMICAWQIPCAPGYSYCSWCQVIHSADEAVWCGDNLQAQSEAELDAERRVERFFEERGAWEPPEASYLPQGFGYAF
jgi:hypothetical protein